MGVWDTYLNRNSVRGNTKRETVLKREVRTIMRKLPNSLSYQDVVIYSPEYGYNLQDENGVQRNVAILNSDNLNEKTIIALPGEDITNGSLVCWMDNHWLVTERDANATVYVRAKMIQCNHLLKWVTQDNEIIEQWSIVEDGTKYLTGEFENREFVATRGDSRVALTLARNKHSIKLDRSNRFLLDDTDAPRPLAYALTKPLKLGWTFNDEGTFKFVLQEVATTENDNIEMGIADYYKHFPKNNGTNITEAPDAETTNKRMWL